MALLTPMAGTAAASAPLAAAGAASAPPLLPVPLPFVNTTVVHAGDEDKRITLKPRAREQLRKAAKPAEEAAMLMPSDMRQQELKTDFAVLCHSWVGKTLG